jgi:hypothetical protein
VPKKSMRKRAKDFMPDPTEMLAVYTPDKGGHGTCCVGFILPRGKTGFEAFDVADRTLGIFPTTKSAADAISASVQEAP